MTADGEKLHIKIVAGKTLLPSGLTYDCALNISRAPISESSRICTYSLQVDILVAFELAVPEKDI